MAIKNVLILGVNGFPYGSARIEKLKLIGKGLVSHDVNVTVVSNSWGIYKKGELNTNGIHEGIRYIYSNGLTYRPRRFILRRLSNIRGLIMEVYYILKLPSDAAIVSITSGMFFDLLKYYILSKLKGFKLFYPHHEEETISLNPKNIIHKINLLLFRKFAFLMLDGAFPISTYLKNEITKKNNKIPQLLLPPFTDFVNFDVMRKYSDSTKTDNYFLYCGSISYFEVIEFIIEAFEKINNPNYYLYLVSFGCPLKEPLLKERIRNSSKSHLIKLYGYLNYDELVEKYCNANALLIPLRDTIQDIARFPHKIAEYTASKRPIITTNIGDISLYFTNNTNALIAQKYDVLEYSELMQYAILNPDKASYIGLCGFEKGEKVFNYKRYEQKILDFIENN